MSNRPPQPPKGSPDLYRKTVELYRQAYKKEIWDEVKFKKKTGHILRNLFGADVWTIKDLDDAQLTILIGLCEHKVNRVKYFHHNIPSK